MLVFAALLLAACATTTTPEAPPARSPAPAESPAEAPQPEPPPAPPKPSPPVRISIASVGDMMIGTDYPQNHLPDDDGVGFLEDVTPYLAAADIAFGNLEGVLLDGGEPAKKCSNPNACYLFRSPTRYAQHFRNAGFDVLSLANNHARDFGEEGRTASMEALAAVGIHHSGREGDFASFEVNGLRVAVLAYAVTKDSNMLLDYELSEQTIADYAASHDIVIVSFHGGAEGRDATHLPFAEEEYYGEPRGDVVRFARMAVDVGADLVIGHGPHVIRAMELYRGRLIAYSLGNFATYYGISVDGIKGNAPILLTTLDEQGRFIEGQIISTEQIRPAGPTIDPQQKALAQVRSLTLADFKHSGLAFAPDGKVTPVRRAPVPRPCSMQLFRELDEQLGSGDGMGHGPDIGSAEWMSVIEFRLGVRGNPEVPEAGTNTWCGYIAARSAARS